MFNDSLINIKNRIAFICTRWGVLNLTVMVAGRGNGYSSLNPNWRKHPVLFGLVLWYIKNFRLFNAKSCFYIYIYILYIFYKYVFYNILKRAWAHFEHTVKGFQVLLCNSNTLTSIICLHTFTSIYMTCKILVCRQFYFWMS